MVSPRRKLLLWSITLSLPVLCAVLVWLFWQSRRIDVTGGKKLNRAAPPSGEPPAGCRGLVPAFSNFSHTGVSRGLASGLAWVFSSLTSRASWRSNNARAISAVSGAMARCMSDGISTSFTSTTETLIPQGEVASSMIVCRIPLILSRSDNTSSSTCWPSTDRSVVWAIWEGRECARGVDRFLMGETALLPGQLQRVFRRGRLVEEVGAELAERRDLAFVEDLLRGNHSVRMLLRIAQHIGHRGGGQHRRCRLSADRSNQRHRDRAVLDDEAAFHIDFAERKLRVEKHPAFGVGGRNHARSRRAELFDLAAQLGERIVCEFRAQCVG